MLTDAASLALVAAFSSSGATLVGVVPFFFGPAVVHGAHKNTRAAILSPVMRVAFMFVGGAIGVAVESCRPDEFLCGLGGAVIGGGIGLATAMIVDWSVAYETGPEELNPRSDTPTTRPRAPTVSLTSAGLAPAPNGGASLVLGGRF